MTTPHSIAEFTDPEVSPANNRHLTVSYASRYPDYSRIPALTLKGQWLEAVGFTTGTEVDVKVMNGCIVLTAQQPQPEESELCSRCVRFANCRRVNRSRCRHLSA